MKGAGQHYGYQHKRLRARWAKTLRENGAVECARCGGLIYDGEPFDLGHPQGADVALGGDGSGSAPEHPRCNRSAGATLGNRLRNGQPPVRVSHDWWA